MGGLIATLLNWLLGLFGVGKADPVKDARREAEAKVTAQERVKALEAALKGQEAARKVEANAHAAEIRYQDEAHDAEKPVPVAKTDADMERLIQSVNEAHRKRETP